MVAPTVSDLRTQLNISNSNQDVELQMYLSAAQRIIERRTGPFTQTSITETVLANGTNLLLTYRPVVEITQLTPKLAGQPTWAIGDLVIDSKAGVVAHYAYIPLTGLWDVTYTYGLSDVPDNVRLATLFVVQQLWKSQRGGARRPGLNEADMMLSDKGFGYALPYAALELLGPDDLYQGIA